MKVLIIPSWYPTPGAPFLGTFFKEQAEALAAMGVDVAVAHVSVGSDFRPSNNGIRRETINGVLTYTYTRPNLTPRFEYGRRLQRTHMLKKIYRLIESEWGRPDVVNLRSSLHGYEAVSLCRKYRLPLFFMEHSSFVITENENSAALKRLAYTMRFAKVNACVSNALYRVMEPYGDVRIIPDMVNGDFFKPLETPPNSEFTFRAMGQLRPIKGYDLLIRAFALLKGKTDKRVKLEIAGDGVLRSRLQELINKLDIAKSCHLVGTVAREQVPQFMNGCDCFVCSSRVETLSCVLNEAAACGKPVISTRCGGPLDIVTDDIGILVPVDDVDEMANAMLVMLDKAGRYDSEKIRELTLNRFSVKKICGQLIEACHECQNTAETSPKNGKGKCLKLFFETLKIGMVTIGGGYAMLSLLLESFTEKHRWLSHDEMLDTIAVAQSMPGPIAVNTSVMVGYRVAGIRGSLSAAAGMILPPLAVMSIIAACYTWFRANEYVAAALRGIRAAVCGLLVWATVKLARSSIKTGRGIWTAVVFVISLLLSIFTKWHASVYILGGLVVGLLFNALYAAISEKRSR
ncbi:MAG: chromate transporter [Oscillospiraceae bacterium]|nr:chromate transporter [Oscillospiraceae bacterium]